MSHDPVAYVGDGAVYDPHCASLKWDAETLAGNKTFNGDDKLGVMFSWDDMPCHWTCDTCTMPLDGSECMADGSCECYKHDGCECNERGRCCDWRAIALNQSSRVHMPHEYHGWLWHRLTGRTSPENGQLALDLLRDPIHNHPTWSHDVAYGPCTLPV